MKFVSFAKKNAKIAGVDKQINFSRCDLQNLDIKFKENEVDRIVTHLPSSKNSDVMGNPSGFEAPAPVNSTTSESMYGSPIWSFLIYFFSINEKKFHSLNTMILHIIAKKGDASFSYVQLDHKNVLY